ncbi:MAG: hypothetical protein K8J08_16180 [Thermoanaerobaculia bacterium]|nr:hypothetical protein [Thermoanaerobaculia bacterium]
MALLLPGLTEQHGGTLHDESVQVETMVSDCGLDHPPSFELAEPGSASTCPGCLSHARSGADLALIAGAPRDWFQDLVADSLRTPPLSADELLEPARGPPIA